MILTEQKVRKVIRQTIRQNNYRINERFYRDLNRNLINEGMIETMSNAFNAVKEKFTSSKNKKNVKGMKKPANAFSQLLVPLAMIALFNSVSHGKVAESGINRIHAAAVEAGEAMEIDAIETGDIDDMVEAGDLLDLIENKQMNLQEMKKLISIMKNLNSCKNLNKELNNLESQLSSLDAEDQENQEDLDNFVEAISNILDRGKFNVTMSQINDEVVAVMTNNL